MIRGDSVEAFLDVVASDAPVPGGGSVAAVAAATGAALVSMVARLTEGREGFESVDERMHEITRDADGARDLFLSLADRDAEAFNAVMGAFKLPKTSDAESTARGAAIQTAFAGAAAVPLEVAQRAVGLMATAQEAVATGNPDATSDGASGGAMLFAAVVCALANVEINAAGLKDVQAAEALREEVAAIRSRAGATLDAIEAAFHDRVSGA